MSYKNGILLVSERGIVMAEKTPIIVFDEGHGGSDSGAVYKGRKEKDDNLRLGLAVGKKIAADYVCTVKHTRTTDIFEKPSKKAQDAIDAKADLLVSIHRNFYNGKAKGFEALVYRLSGTAYSLAKKICAKMKAEGFTDRGAKKRTDLTVISKPEKKGIPVVLLEAGFIDSEADNKLFDSKFDKIVKDIVECIADEMKLKKKSVASAKPVEKTVFKNGDYNKNVKTTANLNVRAGRGTDYKILGTLEKGTVVKALYILEKDGVQWASIDYGKDVGYISLNYVTPVK